MLIRYMELPFTANMTTSMNSEHQGTGILLFSIFSPLVPSNLLCKTQKLLGTQ